MLHLEEDGRVVTNDREGDAFVLVEETTPKPRLNHGFHVVAAPIYSMIVEYGVKILNLPLGADAELSIAYLDSFGRSFAKSKELCQ